MREYLLKRVLLMVPTPFLVTILVFLLMRMIPGDVVLQMLEGYAYADSVEALRRELGLDKPMHIQYLEWMGVLLRGDLGHSLWTKESIVAEFARRFPVTLELALLTIIVSVTFGVGVGVLSAVRQESWLDYAGRVVAIMALAMPYFWLAILVVVLPAIYFRWTPLWTYVPLTTNPLENLKILIFPGSCSASREQGRSCASCAHPCWRCSARITSAPPGRKAYQSVGSSSSMPSRTL